MLVHRVLLVIVLRKKNENIHLFIVDEEYERNKKMQPASDDLLRKAEPPTLTEQNYSNIVIGLEKIHPNFEVGQEDESLQTSEGLKQIDPLQIAESSSAINDLDLLVSLQKMKTEEQELFEQKQRLLTTEQNLHNKIVKEIDKKKMVITNLKSEITDLLNKCKELDQALGMPVIATEKVNQKNFPNKKIRSCEKAQKKK